MKQRGKWRFLGHPIHPIVTHFPMALLPVSLLGDLIAAWTGSSSWWSFSYYTLAIGLILSVPALVTGMMDFMNIPQEGSAESAAMRHMLFILTSIAMYAGSFFVRFGIPIPAGWRLIVSVSLSLLGLIFLLIGGWFGGQLVYRHGIGSELTLDQTPKGKS